MSLSDDIPATIIRLRKDRKWSQMELARRSGVSAPYICQIEGGKRQGLDVLVLQSIASGLGLKMSEFFEMVEFTEVINQQKETSQ